VQESQALAALALHTDLSGFVLVGARVEAHGSDLNDEHPACLEEVARKAVLMVTSRLS
jgi:hypothetical protein